MLTKKITVDALEGYANGTKIVDENRAVNAVEIPVMNGRDVFYLNFYRENHTEYLRTEGQAYISEAAVKPIFAGKSAISTIPASGQAKWYKIDQSSAHKTLTVDAPESGGFAVYDDKGTVVNFSVATHKHSAVLLRSGLIVFGGQAGDVFNIKLK